jgi:hypothetical protein
MNIERLNEFVNAWVSAIHASVKEIVNNYNPTGQEQDFSMKTIYDAIDHTWPRDIDKIDENEYVWFRVPTILFNDFNNDGSQCYYLHFCLIKRKTRWSEYIYLKMDKNGETIPIKFVEQGILILDYLKQRCDEIYKKSLIETRREEKIRNLIECSADATIHSHLKGTGLSYHIDFKLHTFNLQLLMPYNRVAQFAIPYESYADFIEGFSLKVDYICKSFQDFPYTVKEDDSRVKWKKS